MDAFVCMLVCWYVMEGIDLFSYVYRQQYVAGKRYGSITIISLSIPSHYSTLYWCNNVHLRAHCRGCRKIPDILSPLLLRELGKQHTPSVIIYSR